MSVRLGWAALLLVVAAMHLGAGWQGYAPSLVFAGAMVVAFLCLPLTRWMPAGLVVFAVVVLALVGGYWIARDSAIDFTDPLPVLLDLVPRLLTAARPAPATPELLVPGALLVFGVSLGVALAGHGPVGRGPVVAAARRGPGVLAGRGRSLFAPVVGVAVLYTCTALLTAGQADRNGVVAAGLLALVAVGWLVVDRLDAGGGVVGGRAVGGGVTGGRVVGGGVAGGDVAGGRGASGGVVGGRVAGGAVAGGGMVGRRAGRVLLGLPAVGVAVVALVAVGLPSGAAFEPRELVEPPVTGLGVASPLPQLASWAGLGDTELFRVRGPERAVRLVALSDYSGAAWRAASLYGPIGAVAAPDLPPGARVDEAEVEITITALNGSWLPTVGRPTAVTLDGAMVDPDSGSLVSLDELEPGLKYRVRGVLDIPDDTDLLDATVPTGDQTRRYLALPGLPYSLAEYARQIVRSARTPYERAVAIEQMVKQGRVPDAQAPVGSSYARLERFLIGAPGEPGANAGTAEQFASAFAVLGRAVGLPTRVVVGFQPAAGEERVVRGSDATAWPEVYFAGWGWVPFDPVAGVSSGGSSAAQKREVLDRLASITASPTSTPLSAPPPLVTPSSEVAVQAPTESRRWVGYAVLGALPVLVLFVLATARLARRRRLRAAGAPGAWAYVLDGLLLASRTPSPDRTAPDIASDMTASPASGMAEQALELARLAEVAAFAPVGPPAVDIQDRGHAWRLARQVRGGLRRGVPWYRRMFWAVDPRPLWRR